MKYKPEIGKIYDTLFFCVEYFNEKAVKDVIINQFTDTSFMLECYGEVKKEVSYLPTILKPLFLYKNRVSTVMTGFFTDHIDFQNDTIDSFLRKIATESSALYSKALTSLFPNCSFSENKSVSIPTSPETYIEALNSSDYPDDLKLQIALLFGNFNYVVSLLTDHLLKIYSVVDALHQHQQDDLLFECEQICTERNLKLYEQLLSFDSSDHSQISHYCFSISLLNQYVAKEVIPNKTVNMLLGFKHEESLHLFFNENNINFRQLLIAAGNDTRISIIQSFAEYPELTASSIAKITKIPLTTVLRHIELLYQSGALYISRREGLQIFYRVNYNLLVKALNILTHKIGGLYNGQQKQRTN